MKVVGTVDLSGASSSPLLPTSQTSQGSGGIISQAQQESSFGLVLNRLYTYLIVRCMPLSETFIFLNDMRIFIYSDDKLVSWNLLNIYH